MKKRLIVDLPIELHNELKILAIEYNLTLSHYIKKLLVAQIYKERMYNQPETENK